METYCMIETEEEMYGPYCPDHAKFALLGMRGDDFFAHMEIVSYGGYGRGELEAPECDTPQHCTHHDMSGSCDALLNVQLTGDGLEYVAAEIVDTLSSGTAIAIDPDSTVGECWSAYQSQLEEVFSRDIDTETVLHHYITSQLWTGRIDWMTGTYENGGECLQSDNLLDSYASPENISTEDMGTMVEDVDNFLEMVTPYLRYFDNAEDVTDEQLGHDFSLTRNGHGAGFWDRGTGALGDWLTRVSKTFGDSTLSGSIVLDLPDSWDSSQNADLDAVLPGTLTVHLEG